MALYTPSGQAMEMLHGWEAAEDVSRSAIRSSHGRHRPHTRGGGYNRQGHQATIKDIMHGRPRQVLVKTNGEVFIKEEPPKAPLRLPTGMRKTLYDKLPGEPPPLKDTINGHVTTDWPYNRGKTPPPLDPQPYYAPVDTRDECGFMMPDGRHPGARRYHAVNGGNAETCGGYLNGLPKSNISEKFSPHFDRYSTMRVQGKDVSKDDMGAQEAMARRKRFVEMVGGSEHLKLQAGGARGSRPLVIFPGELCKGTIPVITADLSENMFTTIPEGFCNTSTLEELNVSHCKLYELPRNLGRLCALEKLSACHNQIAQLPHSWKGLAKLVRLDLAHNRLATLPETMTCLGSLTELILTGNNLQTEYNTVPGQDDATAQLPSFEGLSSLTRLNLDVNQLSVVPAGLGSLCNLVFLNLSHNRLVSDGPGETKHPALDGAQRFKDLSTLGKLEALLLVDNKLTSFPSELCNLGLRELSLAYNPLTNIPYEIGQLTVLEHLNLDYCPIMELPPSIAHMEAIKLLTTKNVPLNKRQGRRGGISDSWNRGTHAPTDTKVIEILKAYVDTVKIFERPAPPVIEEKDEDEDDNRPKPLFGARSRFSSGFSSDRSGGGASDGGSTAASIRHGASVDSSRKGQLGEREVSFRHLMSVDRRARRASATAEEDSPCGSPQRRGSPLRGGSPLRRVSLESDAASSQGSGRSFRSLPSRPGRGLVSMSYPAGAGASGGHLIDRSGVDGLGVWRGEGGGGSMDTFAHAQSSAEMNPHGPGALARALTLTSPGGGVLTPSWSKPLSWEGFPQTPPADRKEWDKKVMAATGAGLDVHVGRSGSLLGQDLVSKKAFRLYNHSPVTPYIPVSSLQGL